MTRRARRFGLAAFLHGLVLVVAVGSVMPGVAGTAAASTVDRLLGDPTFGKSYRKYSAKTAKLPIRTLNHYLDSAIEDVFLNSSSIAQTDLTAEVRDFRRTLWGALHRQRCGGGQSEAAGGRLANQVAQALTVTAGEVGILPTPHAYGRLTGITENILGQVGPDRVCRSGSFSELE